MLRLIIYFKELTAVTLSELIVHSRHVSLFNLSLLSLTGAPLGTEIAFYFMVG